LPHLEFCSQERGGKGQYVYLMDMSDLYLVVVRLRDWEFMDSASHINANKAVRGLAADLQDFYEEGQRSSAAHLMQQGARAALAIETVGPVVAPTGERMELELTDRKLDLKRKAEDWELQVAERRIELVERQMTLEQRQIEQQMTDVQCQINPYLVGACLRHPV
jgi:hypothetical protein